MINTYGFTPDHRRNLTKLADHLDSLGPDYEHFDMLTYVSGVDVFETNPWTGKPYVLRDGPQALFAQGNDKARADFLHDCGTTACALGHGPLAGVGAKPSDMNIGGRAMNWERYAQRFIPFDPAEGESDDDIVNNPLWLWLFSPAWGKSAKGRPAPDNTPRSAAARIRYVLSGRRLPTSLYEYLQADISDMIVDGDESALTIERDLYASLVPHYQEFMSRV